MKSISRRSFTKQSALGLAAIPFLGMPKLHLGTPTNNKPLTVHLFSKHLQFLTPQQAAEKTAEMGFSGLDLTVRPNGHILPETVADALPKAIEDIKKGGSTCTMMTTAVGNASNNLDAHVLQTAANLGIKYYRANWFKYSGDQTMEEDLNDYQQKVKHLSELNKKLGIVGCYQNHAGRAIGGSLWEVKSLLEQAHPDYFGVQYDIRHAVVEGGLSWENGLQLIHDKIKTIVLKDFKWGKVNGKWKPINVPIGEGMVDFKKYFSLLKAYHINVPVSLHLEYDLGGAERGLSKISVDPQVVFKAMKKDLNKVQQLWQEA